MSLLSGLFGGNDAEKAAREQRRLQAVSNDRQISEVNRQSAVIGASRRAPRGRRLFEDGPEPAAKTLGSAA